MKFIIFVIFSLLLGLGSNSQTAHAAPFCLHTPGLKNYCYYYDPSECRRDARKLGGSCRANRANINLPSYTSGQFCVVLTAGYPQCLYQDYKRCEQVALRQNGICITKSETLSSIDDIRQNRLRRSLGDGRRQDQNSLQTIQPIIPGLPEQPQNPLYNPGLDIRLNN